MSEGTEFDIRAEEGPTERTLGKSHTSSEAVVIDLVKQWLDLLVPGQRIVIERKQGKPKRVGPHKAGWIRRREKDNAA